MHRIRSLSSSTSLLFTCLLAAGCGGGGSKTADGGTTVSDGSVDVSSSPSSIAYGASTKIAWSTKNPLGFQSCNFGLDRDSYKGGTLTDTPGTTTIYTLKMYDTKYKDHEDSTTVTVAPIAKNVLVVGDATKAGPTQIQSFVKTVDTAAVDVAAAVPDPSAAYDILVVSPTMVYASTAKAQVKRWLDAGKGVVLCGRAPRLLATGDLGDSDVSAIGSWFFGVNELEIGYASGGRFRSSPDGLVKVAVTLRGGYGDASDSEGSIRDYGPQVDAVDQGLIDAYAVPTGGKLLFSGSPVGYGNKPGGTFQQAFESAFRWVGQ